MKMGLPYERMADVRRRREYSRTQTYYRCGLALASVATLLLLAMTVQNLLATTGLHPFQSIVPSLSIPEGLVFNSSITNPSVYQAWLNLIVEARSSIDISSFYWTLTNKDTSTHEPTAYQGEEVLKRLSEAAGKVSVRIAVNKQKDKSVADLKQLASAGANIRWVNMLRLTEGVLHTKFWIVDKKHIFIGSANMDWRSLTQVKEVGVVVYNCSCLAEDLGKIFEAYWFLGQSGQGIPSPWPSSYATAYNMDTPLQLPLNGTQSSVYLSSAPPALCAEGRTADLQSILSVIADADQFVYVAVMNYLPAMEYTRPKRYWAEIDTQLRQAAYDRQVRVRLLISYWASTQPLMRLFVVPSSPSQKEIPFARVNHNKYMVTDKIAYIGTSNWSGDYFEHTAGAALVVNQTASQTQGETTVQSQLQAVFERDWDSAYTTPVDEHFHNYMNFTRVKRPRK
ncbi:hypothetical protein CRUP_027457 [Coryphaenoides rupestris]|nr:hypothetical protein CRUP_027457 [Coryphaenoides rupestris]